MLSIILALTLAPVFASECRDWNPKWKTCTKTSDCTVIADECGQLDKVVNKAFAKAAAARFSCLQKVSSCLESKTPPKAPPFKCHKKMCLRLSDIIGEAVARGNLDLVKSTLKEAGDPELSLSHIHETPLTLAALNARVELVEYLLSQGANVNHTTTNGYSALIFAAGSRNQDKSQVRQTVELLLKAGADKTRKNYRGETALDEARAAKNDDLENLLK